MKLTQSRGIERQSKRAVLLALGPIKRPVLAKMTLEARVIRNFLTGIVWGGVVAGFGLAVISQVAPLPVASADQPALKTAAATEIAVAAPEAETDSNVAAGGSVAGAADGAANSATAPNQVIAADGAAVPAASAAPQAVPPEPAPNADSAPTAAEPLPAAVPVPAMKPNVVADAPAIPEAPVAARPAPDVGITTDAPPAAPQPDQLATASDADAVPAVADPPLAQPTPKAAPETDETLLKPAPEVAENPAPALITLDPAPVAPPVAPPAARPAPAVPDTAADQPTPAAELPKMIVIDAPKALPTDAGINKIVVGVTSDRMPRIGDAAPADTDTAAGAVQDTRPLVAFARAYTNDAAKPLFAVVLIDAGGTEADRAKLAALPFPISFVIDPLSPGAADAEAIYRAAGQEVIMLASGIPQGATASDLEQTFQAHGAVLAQAVAVIDLAQSGFQDNRPLATLVVPIIQAQGRGLLTFDQGLNAADQVARRENLPAAVIFRQLDGAGETGEVIRRYLDRAAFKAAQEGRVVVLGTTRAETIAALLEWTVEGRAASVSLAPVSAVMSVQ